MELEDINKEENTIKTAFNLLGVWIDKIGDEYTARNEIAMDAKMYLSLNHLYLKRKQLPSLESN